MRKRTKIVLTVSGLLLAAGAVTSIATARRGDGGAWQDRSGASGMWHERRGRRGSFGGRFGREITRDDFDSRTRERFARFDSNSDGVIDTGEVAAAVSTRMDRRRGRRGERGQRMLKRFDTNKDGKVSVAEFEDRVKKKFARFDLNNDGKVTDEDLPPHLRGRGILSGDAVDVEPMFGRRGRGRKGRKLARLRGADANKDGEVTLLETMAAARKRFSRWDKNGDAAVDQSDLDALKKEAADYRVRRFIHRYGAEADRAGAVTRAQFEALAGEKFAMRDANNDGKLTRDEFGRRRGGWRSRWRRHRERRWQRRGPAGGKKPDANPPGRL